MNSVVFSENIYENLSNFSAHQIQYNNIIFPTCEHLYHYLRYEDIKICEEILNAKSPYGAHKISQKYKQFQKKDFGENKINIMKKIFLLKIQQHEDVCNTLKKSGNMVIEKRHPEDEFWGMGKNGKGQNIMGKLWMKIRNELFYN